MGKMDEMIVVAPREQVFAREARTFHGVQDEQGQIQEIIGTIADTYTEKRRGDAEEDPSWKQPIPYVVIRRGEQLFAYERLAGGGEGRLHNKLSLGFGGHMNAESGVSTFQELLHTNADRELEEELHISSLEGAEMQALGLINDDDNAVGEVHLGILYTFILPEHVDVQVKETEQIRGFWTSVEELSQPETYERLETWSQFVVDILDK
ncbi:hypothetical protein [Marinococcus luteus]|uniref:hypothetical protein n=1 Tax=Marinococcus luteus TaxID=1122204 RepID=UPI002ACC39C0|nr:hypothetical protein [Marinococcus luteus]MDZ5783586.1 hypothetical protein [Marinococcus luteus]